MIDLHVPTFDTVEQILHVALYELKKGNIDEVIDDLTQALQILDNLNGYKG
jgi:hypothetical protein